MEPKTCQQCGKVFAKPKVVSKQVWASRRFCSLKCYGQTTKKPLQSKQCKVCGTVFYSDRDRGAAAWARRQYCSQTCAYQDRKGAKHWNWKDGGRYKIEGGYWATKLPPDHRFLEMAQNSGRVLEHRLVMAEHLGRVLAPHETIHHINGDRADNRLENLELRVGRHGKGANGAHCPTCTCFD